MIIGGKWEGRKKRCLNLLFEKGEFFFSFKKIVLGCVVDVRTRR
jgi:hypothetical protein